MGGPLLRAMTNWVGEMTKKKSKILFALTALLFSSFESAIAAPQCAPPASRMSRTELLFGAGHVSRAAWRDFLAREVTPRFPYGLTAFEAYGQWRGPDGHIAMEPSRVLLIWHGADENAKIDAIRGAYKERFHQQSVMRVDGLDCVSF
jgi:hypothetical protein